MADANMNVFFNIMAQDQFSDAFKKAQEETKNLESELGKLKDINTHSSQNIINNNAKTSDSFTNLTNKIANYVGAYIGIQGAIKSFTEFAYFDKYIQKIGAITHAESSALKILKNDIRAVSKETGAGLIELAEGGTIFASAGLQPGIIKEYLKIASEVQMASREELNIPQIAQMMAVMKKSFPLMEAKEMGDTMAWMLDKVENINFLDLSNSLGKSGPLAKQLGISIKELLAIESGDIINIGGMQASTGMKNLLQELDSNKDTIAKKMQIQDIDFTKTGGLIKFLNEVDAKFKTTGRAGRMIALKNIFGDNETTNRLNGYVDNLKDINKLYGELGNSANGFLGGASERMRASDYVLMKHIIGDINLIFVNIGSTLSNLGIPQQIKSITNTVEELTKALANLSEMMAKEVPKGTASTVKNVIESLFLYKGLKPLLTKQALKTGAKAVAGTAAVIPPVGPVGMATNIAGKLAMAALTADLVKDAYDYLQDDKKIKMSIIPNNTIMPLGDMGNEIMNNILNKKEENKIKLNNQEIKITLNNNSQSKFDIEEVMTTNNNSTIEVEKRDYLNR